jgi:hypothetical protein
MATATPHRRRDARRWPQTVLLVLGAAALLLLVVLALLSLGGLL